MPVSQRNRWRTPYKNLHLYDGGVYDNLGLEPYVYFDVGKQQPKIAGTVIPTFRTQALHAADGRAPFFETCFGRSASPISCRSTSRTITGAVHLLATSRDRGSAGAYTCVGTKIRGGDQAKCYVRTQFPDESLQDEG